MENINYSELKEFDGLYLEDSFVLLIVETPKLISFQMEFVLTKDHPKYQNPLVNQMYCYNRGEINFINPNQVLWKYKNQNACSIDANGEIDFGNIDVFYKSGDEYSLQGDWGSVMISCKTLQVKLQ